MFNCHVSPLGRTRVAAKPVALMARARVLCAKGYTARRSGLPVVAGEAVAGFLRAQADLRHLGVELRVGNPDQRPLVVLRVRQPLRELVGVEPELGRDGLILLASDDPAGL